MADQVNRKLNQSQNVYTLLPLPSLTSSQFHWTIVFFIESYKSILLVTGHVCKQKNTWDKHCYYRNYKDYATDNLYTLCNLQAEWDTH